MNFVINRRNFLAASVGSLVVLRHGLRAAASDPLAFIDESGIFGSQDPFVIGIAVVKDPDQTLNELNALRRKHRYMKQLMYNSTDPDRVAFVTDLIDYFVKRSGATFHGRIVENSRDAPGDRTTITNAYFYHYRQALRAAIPTTTPIGIRMRPHSRSDTDARLRTYLSQEIDGASVELVDKKDQLLQLADFLTGNIRGELLKAAGNGKQEIIKTLAKQVNAPSLHDPKLTNSGVFRVVTVRV